jgi:two-component system sensor histidine kinase KdpD
MPADSDNRPDPDQLLRKIAAEERQYRRGSLKIFLGYASGVGKSFRMLNEGLRRKQRGEDVVIGGLQRNADPTLNPLVDKFEILPPLLLDGKEAMDIRAILRRRPQVCLIDGLAQNNPPSCHNQGRYQDAQQLREAGITIITAVNLQHIKELRDQVESLTGKHVEETIPKSFLTDADEIEIVDIPPEQLIERVGKQPDEAAQAEERRRLSELREIALLLAAEVVDHQLKTYLEANALDQQTATQERILICTTPRADASAMIAAGKRAASRFHGELYVVYIQQANLSPADQSAIERQLALARESGAHVEVLQEQDPVAAILRFAHETHITQIYIGRSLRDNWWNRLWGNRVDHLIRAAEGMDVCVFPH